MQRKWGNYDLKSKQIPPKLSTKNTILKTWIIWTSLNIRTYTHQNTLLSNWRSNLQTERRYCISYIWPKTYMQNVNKLLQIDSRRQNFKKRKRLKQAPLRRGNDQKALEKVFREMQTKTIIRYYYSSTRTDKIKDWLYQVLLR